jgi:hypothetical protein
MQTPAMDAKPEPPQRRPVADTWSNRVTPNDQCKAGRPARRKWWGRLLAALLGATVGCDAPAAGRPSADAPRVTARGFGTLGLVRSDQDHADVVANTYLQPNGAGHTHRWDFGVDSKLGGQLDADFGGGLSAVLQVVAKHRYDNSWTPELEWANVKYQVSPMLSLRAGRTVSPTFMYSDTANVGYANPWLRGPQELYGLVPITHLDGIDLVWNTALGAATDTVQINFGGNSFNAVDGLDIEGSNAWIVSNTLEYSFVTARIGYLVVDLSFDSDDLDALTNGLAELGETLSAAGFADAGRRADLLADRYQVDDTPLEILSAGLRLTPGNWLLLGEWARLTDAGLLPRTRAWYLTAGYRLHRLRPYVTFAALDSNTSAPATIPLAGLPAPLAAAVTAMDDRLGAVLQTAAPSQHSWTLGARWDLAASAAVKFEYQHVTLDDDSAGRFGNLQPDFRPGGAADLFTIAVDFVF